MDSIIWKISGPSGAQGITLPKPSDSAFFFSSLADHLTFLGLGIRIRLANISFSKVSIYYCFTFFNVRIGLGSIWNVVTTY